MPERAHIVDDRSTMYPLSVKKKKSAVRLEHVTLAKGSTVRFRRAGNGPVGVLFIHGWACTSRYWESTLDGLAGSGVTAIAVDLPGSGGSSRFQGEEFTFGACADHVMRIIEALDMPVNVIVGHSMGGPIAAIVSAAKGCERLVLESYCPMAPHRAARLERLRQLEQDSGERSWIDDIVRSWFVKPIDPAILATLLDDVHATSTEVLAEGTRSILKGLQDEEAIRHCSRATWIFGEADSNRSIERVVDLAEQCGSSLRLMPEIGHVPHLEHTEAFVELLVEEVRKVNRSDDNG